VTRAVALPGFREPVLPLVMGNAFPEIARRADPMWEAFVERGGTAFYTAYHYGGTCQKALGRFLEHRGARASVAIVGKGAHTPYCAPEHVGPQLEASLERLRTDYVDLYLLHRDDPAVPVGEWAAALNDELAAGRVRALGASNWTVERYAELNAYAARNGLVGLSLLSNQLSLARWKKPVWEGCLDAGDDATLEWLERTQTPLLAWSSQARGFFSGLRDADPEIRRCWATSENLERRRRATELAARLGVEPTAVALAWVLARPFPTLAVVGPRSLEELEASWQALAIDLTASNAADLDVVTLPG